MVERHQPRSRLASSLNCPGVLTKSVRSVCRPSGTSWSLTAHFPTAVRRATICRPFGTFCRGRFSPASIQLILSKTGSESNACCSEFRRNRISYPPRQRWETVQTMIFKPRQGRHMWWVTPTELPQLPSLERLCLNFATTRIDN